MFITRNLFTSTINYIYIYSIIIIKSHEFQKCKESGHLEKKFDFCQFSAWPNFFSFFFLFPFLFFFFFFFCARLNEKKKGPIFLLFFPFSGVVIFIFIFSFFICFPSTIIWRTFIIFRVIPTSFFLSLKRSLFFRLVCFFSYIIYYEW